MAEERVYTIPLREIVYSARQYRGRKAMNILKKFLQRHLKTSMDKIKIGQTLNEAIWAKGIQKPPSKVKISVRKEEDIFRVELFGHKPEKKEKKKEEKEKKEEKKKKEKPKEKKKKKPSMDWLKKDLKKYAKKKGIKVKSRDTKKDILKKIKKS